MIKFMQKHAKYFYVLFILIIISFIFFYIGPLDQSSSHIPFIEIGEEKVYLQDYLRIYDNMTSYYKTIYKDEFNEELIKKLKLQDQVIDTLIMDKLLLLAARKLNIKVTDRELNDSIMSDPTFAKDGVFSKEVYNRVLELNRLSPTLYEERKRNEIIVSKTKELISLASSDDVEIPEKFKSEKSDEKFLEVIKSTLLKEKQHKIVLSYVNGLKKLIPVKIKYDLINQ
ncbi:SurA protein [Candidatus Magnetoovum chiemensis]|nr:SurA protein [Candidatus Magnetoovum chiemensis]